MEVAEEHRLGYIGTCRGSTGWLLYSTVDPSVRDAGVKLN
jgi:hypothetical protein